MNAMLEHQKRVLFGVAQSPYLFRKELSKSLEWLSKDEVKELYSWIKVKFGSYHANLVLNFIEDKSALRLTN